LTFQDAQVKLLAYVRGRIQSGDLTERRLARLIGISQPHAHNVLKGARNLSPQIFDSILKYFQISLLDLAPLAELEASLKRRRAPEAAPEVPFMESSIGPGKAWPARVNWQKSLPLPYPSRTVPEGLVMVRLAEDPNMRITLAGWDIALLDTATEQRSDISPEGLYVVVRGEQAVLRYIRAGARSLYLLTDANRDQPNEWEELRIRRVDLLEMVKGRIQWLGRERDLPQTGRFLYAAISS